jgi:putative membrane protein insertion efficiency factor
VRRCVLALLKAYRLIISPLLPASCRFYPTCSSYAIDAVTRYGVISGGWMALKRLLRCHPFDAGGFDPVR